MERTNTQPTKNRQLRLSLLTIGRGIEDGYLHIGLVVPALVGIVMLASTSFAWSAERVTTARQRLENMSPHEKADLLKKQQRFLDLPVEQQKHLRQMHRRLADAPDADQLHAVEDGDGRTSRVIFQHQPGANCRSHNAASKDNRTFGPGK